MMNLPMLSILEKSFIAKAIKDFSNMDEKALLSELWIYRLELTVSYYSGTGRSEQFNKHQASTRLKILTSSYNE